MFKIIKYEFEWHNKKFTIETGKIGRQADSSITVKYQNTIIMVNITKSQEIKEKPDFFPLTVNYTERYYATGKFPGGFIKRESKPSEREILISRMIDRPLRPLFPKDFFHEVNINCTLLSYDYSISTELIAFIGVIAALQISSLPFHHFLGITRIGIKNNILYYNINPKEKSDLEIIIIGKENSIMMIESSSREINQDKILKAIELGQKEISFLITEIKKFTSLIKNKNKDYQKIEYQSTIDYLINNKANQEIQDTFKIQDKKLRNTSINTIYKKHLEILLQNNNSELYLNSFNLAFNQLKKQIFRNIINDQKVRIDNRKAEEIRPISSEINILPQTHGSSLFTRGDTQVISTITLGSTQDMQTVDNVTETKHENFMLHYNFPPHSVGECGQLKPPSRREIGHGQLARKSIQTIFPIKKSFPYTVKATCEVTESNGSSSMATVCATSMALMSAGVPIKSAISGIAMGLILNDDSKYTILSDISGEEDTYGDMDFKITTTSIGITSL